MSEEIKIKRTKDSKGESGFEEEQGRFSTVQEIDKLPFIIDWENKEIIVIPSQVGARLDLNLNSSVGAGGSLIGKHVDFTSTDATPTVANANVFETAGTDTITDFDDGQIGQVIFIKATDSITITDNAAIKLEGGQNYDMVVGDTLTLCMFDDQVWHELSRLVLSGNTVAVKKVLWVGAGGIKAPGSKPATFAECGLTGVWQFGDVVSGQEQSISGTVKIPNDMDITVVPTFHVGWSANGSSPGLCEWLFSYLWLSANEDTCGAAQDTITILPAASSVSNGFVFSTFTGMDLPSATDKAMLWKLTRLSAGNDTIADTVELRGNAFTYESNKLGTLV